MNPPTYIQPTHLLMYFTVGMEANAGHEDACKLPCRMFNMSEFTLTYFALDLSPLIWRCYAVKWIRPLYVLNS